MKPGRQRCIANAKDGTRCGRTARPGTMLCNMHDGSTVTPVMQPVRRTPLEIIEKLMTDPDPAIRLRAANAYLDHRSAAPANDWDPFLKALTDEERARMHELLQAFEDYMQELCARRPDLRPDDLPPPPRIIKEPNDADVKDHPSSVVVPDADVPAPAAGNPDPDDMIEVIGSHGPRLVRRGDLSEAL